MWKEEERLIPKTLAPLEMEEEGDDPCICSWECPAICYTRKYYSLAIVSGALYYVHDVCMG
jgi:hypothetical protein